MKNVWKDNKSLIILLFIGILIFILVWILLYPDKDKIIQAELIVILVFITLFYAIQTQKLVRQEESSLAELKRKRTTDFWEKRLIEFYKPFVDKLNNMMEAIHKEHIDRDRIFEIWKNTKDFIWKNDYMISENTCKKIEKLNMILFEFQNEKEEKLYREFRELEKEVREIVIDEWNDIKKNLREAYDIEREEVGHMPSHKIYSSIVEAVQNGKLEESFTKDDFRKACPDFTEGTYNVFLKKHRVGNPGGNTELFKEVSPGKFELVKPFKYGLD